jgi:hypothetical protein
MQTMNNARAKAAVLLALGAAATAFAALAFANNVSVVARWWAAFAAAGGVSSEMPARISGFLPWLDWAAVDHSCATTFIPLLGLALATRGVWRILRRRPADPAFFPFFRSFDQLVVALGLIGTLWGIILIGWHDLDAVSMRDLMLCLHTALFSTLMAVVWVYLVDHPLLRPLLRGLLREAGLDGAARDRAALDELLASLREGASGLRAAWDGERESLAALSAAVAGVRGEADRFAESGARTTEAFASLEARLAAAGDAFEARQRDYEAAAEARARAADEALAARLDAHQKALDERARAADEALAARLDAHQKALDERLADVRAAHGEFLALSRELSAFLADIRAAQSEQAAAAVAANAEAAGLRDRLAAETASGNEVRAEAAQLRGDLAAERGRLAEEQARAERAEATLDRIHSAFSPR